MKTNTISSYNR